MRKIVASLIVTSALIYGAEINNEKYLIISNLNSRTVRIPKNSLELTGELLISNYKENQNNSLAPWECRLYKI